MVEDPQEIILEHLRYMRGRVDTIDENVKELRQSVLDVREQINGIRGDFLRLERALAAQEVDIDRIKNRLDLSEN